MPAAFQMPAAALELDPISPNVPVYDGARLIATEKRTNMAQQLSDFEQQTGWRVRVLTSYGADNRPSDNDVRGAWRPDKRTVVINFDSANPNLTNFVYLGDEVLMKLRRPWWYELQGRYGNLFYIRDEGEQAAILNTVSALTTCLGAPEGCKVVPGLPSDQYQLTLVLSAAGGLVAGAVSRLEPQGWVKSRWLWLLLFSPLWGSLFVNFGLAPILQRTDDPAPIIANTAAFLVAAALPNLGALLRAPDTPQDGGSSGSS